LDKGLYEVLHAIWILRKEVKTIARIKKGTFKRTRYEIEDFFASKNVFVEPFALDMK
jgi:hypothetical protein